MITVRGQREVAAALDGLAGDLADLTPDAAAERVAATIVELERPHRRTGRYLRELRTADPVAHAARVVAGAPYSVYVEAERHPMAAGVRIATGGAVTDTEHQIADRIRKRGL